GDMCCASVLRAHVPLVGVGRAPSRRAFAVAPTRHALLIDLSDNLAVAGEERPGRAHLGAYRQLALSDPVLPILLAFGFGVRDLRAAGAVGALVHLAAGAEIRSPRVLRSAERTGVETVTAADTGILVVQHHADVGLVDARDRTNGGAGCVIAVHAGDADRFFAWLAVVDRDHAAAHDAPRHLVLVLAGDRARVALDASVGVAQEFHACHVGPRLHSRPLDLAERGFGLLHVGDCVVAIGRCRVR